ncbi:MAG TPA: MFS transporter [Thermoleophilia bacterium]|nr:MFS transporter [Thermoleophilia bacterium]
MATLSDNLGALREPEFRKLFIGQAASIAGTMLTLVALPFAVLAIGGSATDIGLVEAAYILPMALMIVVGGVWSDRLPRRMVMLSADVVRAALQFLAAGLLLGDVATVWMLVLLQVGMGLCDAFFRPAYTGLVPQVVSSARLQQANALQGLVQSGSITLGAATGGLLVAALGAGWAIGVDGLTFVVSAWFLWRLHPVARTSAATPGADTAATPGADAVAPSGVAASEGQAPVPAAGFLDDLRLGWREFTSHTWLWVMVSGASLFLFAVEAPLTVLGPVVARDAYDGARTWGFLAAAMGLGQIAGGAIALRWRPRRPFLVLALGMSVTALPMAMLATTAPAWALFSSAAGLGVVWGMFDPFWLTAMQREVPPDMISRVSSYDYLGSLAFYPAGLALAGPVADLIGISATLWIAAGCGVAVSLFWVSWRDVRAVHELGPPGLAVVD